MCNCMSEVDELLKPHNARLAALIQFGEGRAYPVIQTEKIEKRRDGKSAPPIKPTFCPFCGERYSDGARKAGPGAPTTMLKALKAADALLATTDYRDGDVHGIVRAAIKQAEAE